MELEAPGCCWKAAHSRRRWNGTYEDFESTCPCVPSQWVIQSAVGNLPLNVMSCTCICAESQEVTWSPPHAQLPGGTSSVDSAQASSVELLTSVSDDDGGGGHGCGAGGEVAHVAAVLPSWMVDQGMVSQIVSQMASQRGGEDRLPGRWWYGILTAKRGSENDLGSTCPIRVIRSVTCRCPGQLAGCWQSVIRSLCTGPYSARRLARLRVPPATQARVRSLAGVPYVRVCSPWENRRRR